MSKHGFEPPFGGLLGHGVGLEFQERPNLVVDDLELKENMVVAIEPRVCVEDAVVGLEDMIRITSTGTEVLTGSKEMNLAYKIYLGIFEPMTRL